MPLKSFRIGATVPGELRPLIERRMESERYASLSEYVVSLILFDIYCHGPHELVGPLMREPQRVRDKVIAQLVADFDNPEARGGDYFEQRVAELLRTRAGV